MTLAPLGIAVAVSTPGLWGIGGQVDAERLPQSWTTARDLVRADDSTVLALPWAQYYNQSIDNGRVRRVLNPMPLFLGGDVIASSDNGLSPNVRERGDRREQIIDRSVDALVDNGAPVSPAAAALGIDWVVLHRSVLDDRYRELGKDDGLELVFDSDGISVFRVTADAADGPPPQQHLGRRGAALAGQIGWLAGVGGVWGSSVRRKRRDRPTLDIAEASLHA